VVEIGISRRKFSEILNVKTDKKLKMVQIGRCMRRFKSWKTSLDEVLGI
jgi:hypothetical protein